MKPALEAPRSTSGHPSIVAFERQEPNFGWNWHYHPEIELTWIRKGSGTRLVGDHSENYSVHDLVLLGSNLPHSWSSSDHAGRRHVASRNQAVVIQFRPEMFPPTLLALSEFTSIGRLFDRAARGLHYPAVAAGRISSAMEALVSQQGLPRWLDLARLLQTLSTLPATPLASPSYRHRRSFKLSSRLGRIITHLEENYREDTSPAATARLVGLTPSSFSRFFRKMTGQTFVDYRNNVRVQHACRFLAETDLSVTEISLECGFNNLANFNRRFREHKGMAPREHRRLHEPSRLS